MEYNRIYAQPRPQLPWQQRPQSPWQPPSQSPWQPSPQSPWQPPSQSPWQPSPQLSWQRPSQLPWQAPLQPQSKFPWVRRIKELIDMFKSYDLNGDGRISRAELAYILRAMGYSASDNEIWQMVGAYDKSGDGTISLSEFIRTNANNVALSQSLNSLQTIFSVFDRDKSGRITAQELYENLRFLGDSSSLNDCYQIIAALDTDGDGVVSFQEFRVLMGIIHACRSPYA